MSRRSPHLGTAPCPSVVILRGCHCIQSVASSQGCGFTSHIQHPAPRGGGGGDDDRQGRVGPRRDPQRSSRRERRDERVDQAAAGKTQQRGMCPVPVPAAGPGAPRRGGPAPRGAAGVINQHAAPVRARAPAAPPAPNEPQVSAPAPVPAPALDFEGRIAQLQAEFEQRMQSFEFRLE
ncbi:hypothetical protein N7493_001044 [Penicillium malachiteum]|uniref:Uncharacterized protein n=1 Tax=Penicillium malachiteum TaxID=1324776 RepID=A0AAD6HXS8_9EURO|nr:hypothetical protein N7493_001044 [Penicillium malachiteum]